jgi:hypothetical protein
MKECDGGSRRNKEVVIRMNVVEFSAKCDIFCAENVYLIVPGSKSTVFFCPFFFAFIVMSWDAMLPDVNAALT